MKLFIYHAPEETPTQDMPQCAIAVDVLRATTTMATELILPRYCIISVMGMALNILPNT